MAKQKTKLQSSNVKSASYDTKTKTLTVAFKKGNRVYEYDTSKTMYTRMTKVKSPGKFVHRNLKPLGGRRTK